MTRVRIPLGIVTGIVFGLFDFKSSVILVNRQLGKERAGFFFFYGFQASTKLLPLGLKNHAKNMASVLQANSKKQLVASCQMNPSAKPDF